MNKLHGWINGGLLGNKARLIHFTELIVFAASFVIAIQVMAYHMEDLEIKWVGILYRILILYTVLKTTGNYIPILIKASFCR